MYTPSSTVERRPRWAIRVAALALAASSQLWAQEPVRLPTMTVTAQAPGPNLMVGVVRDTAGTPIPEAEVTVPGVSKRLYTNADGVFRFEGVPRGTHSMRARKLGYAPQIREFVVKDSGGLAEFELVPIARALPPMVSSVGRLGLSGVVGDTAFDPVFGAQVRLLGAGQHTVTDSLGAFFLPAESGRYMVSITRPGFRDRLVGVTIPRDSGRRITAWLQPSTLPVPVNEAHNVEDLQHRMAWAVPQRATLYTREQLSSLGVEWVVDAVNTTTSKMGLTQAIDRDCMAVANGGPSVVKLSTLTIEETESVEIYAAGGAASRGAPGATALGFRGARASTTPTAYSNAHRALSMNQARFCPLLVYVWLR